MSAYTLHHEDALALLMDLPDGIVLAGFRIERHEPKPDDPSALMARLHDPSQTSTGVDDLPADRPTATSAQSAAADAGQAADAPGPYPSSAIPSDGA